MSDVPRTLADRINDVLETWDGYNGDTCVAEIGIILDAERARPAPVDGHAFEPMRGPDDTTCSRCLSPHAAPPDGLDVERLREAVHRAMPDSTARVGGAYAPMTNTMFVVTIDRDGYAEAIAREYASLAADTGNEWQEAPGE